MAYAREYFKKYPQKGSLSLGINDGGGYCETELDNSLPKGSRFARVYYKYANAVARAFDKEFPDRYLGFLLYGEARMPPKDVKIHPRLIGFLVWPSYQLITPEGRKGFEELVDRQAQVTPRFALYDWFYGAQLYIPRLQIRQAQHWLRYGYQRGARHVKAEAYPNWGLDGFKYWMHAALLWDPARNVDSMMDEVFPRFFKESAEPMRAYFKIVEEYSTKPVLAKRPDGTESVVNFAFRRPEQFESFSPEAVRRCAPLLVRAERLAKSYLVQRRVRYFRTGFEIARRMTEQYHLGKQSLPMLADAKTRQQGIALLVQAVRRVNEVESIFRWGLAGDAHCVVNPFPHVHPMNAKVVNTGNPAIFEMPTRGRMNAGRAISEQVVARLRAHAPARLSRAQLDDAIAKALDHAFAQVTDRESLRLCRGLISPLVRKMIVCRRVVAPKLDGKLDDPCWADAAVMTNFDVGDTAKPAQFRTTVRVCHDGERLYAGFRCDQDASGMLLWTKNRDGRVWREESVEVLMYKPTDSKPTQRFQAVVGARGNVFDYYAGSAKWDGDIGIGTAINKHYYVVEISVPLKAIGMHPNLGRFLRINFARNVYARPELRGGVPLETSVWSTTASGNLDPQAAGWLIFSE